MWYLVTSSGKHLYLKPNKEVTFGRKKSDILLQNDESISRLHASICIKPKEIIKNNEPISTCEVKDANSKYGTYIILSNDEKVEVTSTGSTLKDGDKIRFGLQHHVFTIVYIPLITVVSTFTDVDKQKLQSILDEIDGMISNEWTSACTHLTVSKAALTEKVTWAMASAVPIVNLNFWEAMKQAIDNGDKLPKPADFVPPIVESLIKKECVSLCVNEKRKTLFRNLIFLHFSVRQYKMYGRMINMAGGKSVLYSKRPLTTSEVCARNVIVLQYSDSETTQSTQGIVPEYETIYNSLRASKRKMISETDIPLAILHCSTEKYCNPKYRFEELLKRSQVKPDSSEVLILDTQDLTGDVRVMPKVISNVPIRTNLNVKDVMQEVKIIPESWDSPASSGATSQSQGRTITSMPKAGQSVKSTLTSEISVERGGAQKIKEAQKAVKYIPETNDSCETQSILRSGTLKESQGAKSASNNEISVERGPAQKVKEVQKAVKYIPETKDSYETQDLLGTGILKVSQDAKSTPNGEISVERGPVQKVKKVQKDLKYIPETKDSYETQDLLRTGTLKARQDEQTTPNGEISIEREPVQKIKEIEKAGTSKDSQNARTALNSDIAIERISMQREKEVCSRNTVKYISESSDSSQSQEILRTKSPNTNQITKSTSGSDVSTDKRSTQCLKGGYLGRSSKCIPETNDSSDETEKSAQCSRQRSQRVRNGNRNLQEISRMKESMIANKGTPSNEVIELIDDDDDDEEEENKLEEILLNGGRSEKHYKLYNSVLNQEKLDRLVHDHSVVVKSPEVNRDCTPLSRVDNNNSTITVSQIERESVQTSRKRNRSLDEFESDEDFLTSTRKRLYSNNSVPVTSPHTVKPSNTVKLSQAEVQNNLLRNNTSSIRASVNFKKFKKVYNKIPQQRITLNDMYIWNMFNVQNL